MRRGTLLRIQMSLGVPQKNIEMKVNQVEFLKFHPADFCQYSTLSILVVVIRCAAQCYDNRAIAIFVFREIGLFLCCKEMSITTRGQDVFDIISAYLEKWILSCNSCVGIYTAGAPYMIGSIKGFVSPVQRENPNVVQTHCFLYREVLVSKTIPDELNQVSEQVVEIVNFIKTRPLKSRLFEKICVDTDSQHKRLILNTEARWLSREKVLCCVHELHKELHIIFTTETHERICEYLQCEFWFSRLEYLAEIFAHRNSLNTSMQGREENILTSSDELVAYKKKVAIWKNRVKDGNFEMFPSVRESCIKNMSPIVQYFNT